MKLFKTIFNSKTLLAVALVLFLTALVSESECLSTKNHKAFLTKALEANLENEASLVEKKHKKKKAAVQTRKEKTSENTEAKVEQFHIKNDTLKNSVYRDLNNTFVVQRLNDFKDKNRNWDMKLLDKQLEDIFKTMNLRDNRENTMNGDRAYMELFFNSFATCDKDGSNGIDRTEFVECFKTDPYLRHVTPTPKEFAAQLNYTDSKLFYENLFDVLDTYKTNYLNFHAYMELRLMIFSWKKCSVNGPFIEETSWECAIEVVSGFKTSSRTTLRNTFYMCLELANSYSIRNIDFISFIMFASGARLYGKINGKEDHDITKNEFNLVLDENMLPSRYNQFVVNTFFQLIHEDDHEAEGIDFQTFIYYDFVLRMYEVKNPQRKWHLNVKEFTNVLGDKLFPQRVFDELSNIPMTNLTNSSYQMYTYLNISTFHKEDDFLLKFVEKKENIKNNKLNLRKGKENQIYNSASNVPFYLNFTAARIFNLIDVNSDGLIDWYDFGHFFQTVYLFARFDPHNKGRITAGEIYEKYHDYSDFPRVSSTLRHRAKRFNLLNQDTYLDVFTCITILRIDDLVSLYTRKVDKTTLYEIELKRIFSKANLGEIRDGVLNKCLRGVDNKNVPKYDWECAFMAAMQENINYMESASDFNTAKHNNITLTNTVFYNIDPELNKPPAKKRFI